MATLEDLLIKIGVDTKNAKKSADGFRKDMSKTWDMAKTGALAGGAAIGAALMTSISSAMETEVAGDKLAASLGATGKEAEDLGKMAGDLYAQGFGASADEVGGAIAGVISSFDNLGEGGVEKMTGRLMNLSKTFEIDVARAAQVAGQAVKSGLVDDATKSLDLLTYSMQSVPAAVREDLLDAVDEYGPFMAGIGIKGEQAFGLLVRSAEKGMYGIDKTGDALKEFTIRATDMSSASKAGYDALGLSQEEMSGKLLKGGETGAKAFDQIIAGLVGMKDPVKQSQAALALFGTPLEDLSVQEIPKFLKGLQDSGREMEDAAGAADTLGETLNDNAATKLEAFKRAAQSALIEQLAKAVPYIEKTFGWLSKNSEWVKPLAVGLGLLSVAIGIVVAATWAWNAALAVNPITWIILAIVAAIGFIVYLATKTQYFQIIWGLLWSFLKKIGAWFAGPFAGFFVMLGQKIAAFAVGAWNFVKRYFGFWQGLFRSILQWGINALASLHQKFMSFVNFIIGIPKRIRNALSNMWDGLKSGFKSAINWVINKWNSISFQIPSFSVFGHQFGGGSIGVPNIPNLAAGGIVPARPGGTLVRMAEAGEDEAAVPISRLPELGGGGRTVIELRSSGNRVDDMLLEILRTAVKDRGGDVQFVVGQRKRG